MTTATPSAAKPSASTPSAHTIASELHNNPAINAAVDQILREVQTRSAKLTDIRPPVAELKESYDAYMKRAADVRGRALLYPYLGSGIGNGALVELMDGSVKWDMICGIGVYFFGHSDQDQIRTAIKASLNDTLQHGNLQAGWESYEFSETLLALAKRESRLKYCFSTTSGCMANENALKVCYQKHAPANRVIAFKDCFMGRSVTMSQIGDAAANRIGIPLSTLVDYMPFYDEVEAKAIGQTKYIDKAVAQLRQLVERYPKQHACFIFEFVQGEGGFNTAPREFFVELIKVCKDAKIAVWDDEIQTFGRTTSMFAYEALNLGEFVDVFCIGKMTQVCATLYTEEYNPGPGLLSGTFTSNTPAFRQGTRALERLRDSDFYGPSGAFARHHAAFSKGIRDIAARHPDWFPKVPEIADIVGGNGGMMKFTPFGGKKDKINKACKHLFDAGVVVFYCGHGPFHIRMLPPLGVFKEQDWPRVMTCIEKGLASCAAEG